jgi:hypothetical protein
VNKPQAKAVIGMLSAAFPREPMPDSSLEMWSAALLECDMTDAKNAVELAALTMDRMPSLHQLVEFCEDIRRQRIQDEAKALPEEHTSFGFMTFGEWLKTRPDMHDRVKRLGPVFAKLVQGAQ